MMKNQDYRFLKYFIHEDLYLIRNDRKRTTSENFVPEDIKTEFKKFSNKNVVLSHFDKKAGLSQHDKDLLSDIFNAIRQPFDDMVLIDPGNGDKFEEKYDFANCRILCFLDSVPDTVKSLTGQEYYKIKESGSNRALLSIPLNKLHKDKPGKKSLWNQLQILYGVQ